MKAMILAAGMGTRLQPITLTKPKALAEVNGTPLLEMVIKRLMKFGFTDIVVNVHHFADQIVAFLKLNNNFGAHIELSDESDLLLDTGGALLKARHQLDDGEPFLVHNVDVITDFDLNDFYNFHLKHRPVATMAVKNRETSRSLLINSKQKLSGWKNNLTGETIISRGKFEELVPTAFSCVHVMSPAIFPLITETGVFSIMKTYLRLAQEHSIMTWNHDHSIWLDVGRIENLKEAEILLK